MIRQRIPLSPGYHAEVGETPGHLHDVYTTNPPPGENLRVHVGTLSKAAVEAWAKADKAGESLGELERLVQALLAGFWQCEEVCRRSGGDMPDTTSVYVRGAGRSSLELFTYGDLRKLADALGQAARLRDGLALAPESSALTTSEA